MIWSERPSRYSGEGAQAFNLLQNIGNNHEIHLLFTCTGSESRKYPQIDQYCKTLDFVKLDTESSELRRMFNILKGNLNIFKRNKKFLSSIYHSEMEKKIIKTLQENDIDLIFTNCPTSPYVRNIDIPKVAHVMDCGSRASQKNFRNSKNYVNKFYWLISYFQYKWIEKNVLTQFDQCIVISNEEYSALQNSSNKLDISIIPNGIDVQFFKPDYELGEDWPSIIFVGTMNHPPNVDAVLNFYSNCYTDIKEKIPEIKFYVVGQKPAKELDHLQKDPTIKITGFVEDVRPFISKSSVVIAPFISGTGVKTKILEAMSMGKVVVSTSIGARGIDIVNNEDIIIADDPQIFGSKIVNLLDNFQLRKEIGLNARKKAVKLYSYKYLSGLFENIFQGVIDNGKNS